VAEPDSRPPPDCDQGFHGLLVEAAPLEADGVVEVQHVCPACGAIEYTVSYTRAAWRRRQGKDPDGD
jgi:hypothetical protein